MITAAAAVMIAVFSSFALSDDVILKLVGIGMATAILVDASVVRMVFVPAIMQLARRANWWLPGVAGPAAARGARGAGRSRRGGELSGDLCRMACNGRVSGLGYEVVASVAARPSMHALSLRRLAVVCALAGCAAVTAALLGTVGAADADLHGRISTRTDRAAALRAEVAAQTRRIRSSAGGLERAQARLQRLQSDLAARQARLRAVEDALVRARARLTRLVTRQRKATDALRENLAAAYRNPQPDIVSVLISARGFTDLLEKADFLKRVARQNARIMQAARTSRADVTKQAGRLAAMQSRQRALTASLERRRDKAQAVQSALLAERARRLAGRDAKRAALRRIERQLSALRRRLARTARAGIATNAGGVAQPPAGAPPAVALVMAAANAIAGKPYLYGGGHAGFKDTAYDCSGSISYALAAAGLVSSPMASGGFMTWGESGPGRWITIYTNPGHMFMVIAGWRFDTTALRGGGTRWTRDMRPTGGFLARHPPGL